jgi:hypothetical protein
MIADYATDFMVTQEGPDFDNVRRLVSRFGETLLTLRTRVLQEAEGENIGANGIKDQVFLLLGDPARRQLSTPTQALGKSRVTKSDQAWIATTTAKGWCDSLRINARQ